MVEFTAMARPQMAQSKQRFPPSQISQSKTYSQLPSTTDNSISQVVNEGYTYNFKSNNSLYLRCFAFIKVISA